MNRPLAVPGGHATIALAVWTVNELSASTLARPVLNRGELAARIADERDQQQPTAELNVRVERDQRVATGVGGAPVHRVVLAPPAERRAALRVASGHPLLFAAALKDD